MLFVIRLSRGRLAEAMGGCSLFHGPFAQRQTGSQLPWGCTFLDRLLKRQVPFWCSLSRPWGSLQPANVWMGALGQSWDIQPFGWPLLFCSCSFLLVLYYCYRQINMATHLDLINSQHHCIQDPNISFVIFEKICMNKLRLLLQSQYNFLKENYKFS